MAMGATVGPVESWKAALRLSWVRWRDVLDEGKLRQGEGGGDAGLVDEDDAEAGADDGFGGDEVVEADARGYVVVVERARGVGAEGAAGEEELLGGEIEDGALVVLFGGGKWRV